MYRALCCSLPANFLLLSSGVILTYISSFLTLSPWRFALFTQPPSSFCRASVSLKFVLPKKIYFSKLNFRTHRSTFGVFILHFVFCLVGWLVVFLTLKSSFTIFAGERTLLLIPIVVAATTTVAASGFSVVVGAILFSCIVRCVGRKII